MSETHLPDTLTRLFVTEIYRADLSQQPGMTEMIEALDDTCRAIADEDEAGQDWSQQHGYLGYTSYASIENITGYASVFNDLKRHLDHHVNVFAGQIDLDLKSRKLKLVSMWINVLEHLGTHSGHIHPQCAISGTFYVNTPPGAAALRFEDPRLGLMMGAPLRKTTAVQDRQSFATLTPQPGSLVLWESWLRHEVPINLSEDVRISISFNYA